MYHVKMYAMIFFNIQLRTMLLLPKWFALKVIIHSPQRTTSIEGHGAHGAVRTWL
jgi:hypothetical protein